MTVAAEQPEAVLLSWPQSANFCGSLLIATIVATALPSFLQRAQQCGDENGRLWHSRGDSGLINSL